VAYVHSKLFYWNFHASICWSACVVGGGPAWARNLKRGRFRKSGTTSRSVAQTVTRSQISESIGGARWSEFADDTPYGMFSFGTASSTGDD